MQILYDSETSISPEIRESIELKWDRICKSYFVEDSIKKKRFDTISKEALNHSFHIENRGREIRRLGRTEDPERDYHENCDLLHNASNYAMNQDYSKYSLTQLLLIQEQLEPNRSGIRGLTARVSGSEVSRPNSLKLNELLDETFEVANDLNPLDAALFFSFRLMYLHPFEDGNGRSVRLYANAILWSNFYPSILIPESERSFYFTVLENGLNSHVNRLSSGIKNLESKMSQQETLYYEYLATKINSGFNDLIDFIDSKKELKLFLNFSGKKNEGNYISLRKRLQTLVRRRGLEVTVSYRNNNSSSDGRHILIKGDFPVESICNVLDSTPNLNDYEMNMNY